jgi:hypothetical protein
VSFGEGLRFFLKDWSELVDDEHTRTHKGSFAKKKHTNVLEWFELLERNTLPPIVLDHVLSCNGL